MKKLNFFIFCFLFFTFYLKAQDTVKLMPGGVSGSVAWYSVRFNNNLWGWKNNINNDINNIDFTVGVLPQKSRELNFGQFGFKIPSTSGFNVDFPLQQTSIFGLWIPLSYENKDIMLWSQQERGSLLQEKYKTTINHVIPNPSFETNGYLDYGSNEGKDLFWESSQKDGDKQKVFRPELAKILSYSRYRKMGNNSRLYNYAQNNSWIGIGSTLFDGYMPEIILYNRVLNTEEKVKIESYLALKYGISLQSNYLSPFNKVLWDRSLNNLYNNRITGISKSNLSDLYVGKSITHYEEAGGSLNTTNNSSNYSDDGITGDVTHKNRLLLMGIASYVDSPMLNLNYVPSKLINTEYLLPGGTFISTLNSSSINPSSGYISSKSLGLNGDYFTFRLKTLTASNYIIGLNESDDLTNRKKIKYSLIIDKDGNVKLSNGNGSIASPQPLVFNALKISTNSVVKIGIEGTNIVFTINQPSGQVITHNVPRTGAGVSLFIDYCMESSKMEIRDLVINNQASINYAQRIIGENYSTINTSGVELSGRQIIATTINAKGIIPVVNNNNFNFSFKTTTDGADVGLIDKDNLNNLIAAKNINFRINITNKGIVSIIEGTRKVIEYETRKIYINWLFPRLTPPSWWPHKWEKVAVEKEVTNSYNTNYIASANSEFKIVRQGGVIKYFVEGVKLPYESIVSPTLNLKPSFFMSSSGMLIRDFSINSVSTDLKDEGYLLWGDNNLEANLLSFPQDQILGINKMNRSWKVIPTNFIRASALDNSTAIVDKMPVTIELSSVGVDARSTAISNKLFKGSSGEANRRQWLIIDQSGTGKFQSADLRFIEQTGYNLKNGDEKLWFQNFQFDIDNNGSDVFTFGYTTDNNFLVGSQKSTLSCLAPKGIFKFWVENPLNSPNLPQLLAKEPLQYKFYNTTNPGNIISSASGLLLSQISSTSPKEINGLDPEISYKLDITDGNNILVGSQISFQKYAGMLESGKTLLMGQSTNITIEKTITLDASRNIISSPASSISYQWYKLNTSGIYIPISSIDGGTKAVITLNTEGDYKVIAISDNGCTSSDFVKISKTIIDKVAPDYPLVSGRAFDVLISSSVSAFKVINVSIFNLMNNAVHTQNYNGNSLSSQIIKVAPNPTLSPGIYFMIIKLITPQNKEYIERVSIVVQ